MEKNSDLVSGLIKAVRALKIAGFLLSFAAILGLIGIVILYGLYRDDIPEIITVKDYRPTQKSKVFAQNGELIAEFGVQERLVLKKNEIPPIVEKAFIASEDKNFYRHHGIDFAGVINAIFQSVSGKRSTLRGASTITQQLAKGLLVKQEGYDQATARTIARKVKEGILARRLEMHLTKEEILWMYLNDVYLGQGAYGVAAAARTYFRKDLKHLSLNEIALIAGLLQAPSRFSPHANLDAALSRQAYVLGRMREDGYITSEQHDDALLRNKDLVIYDRENNFRKLAPYFSETVRRMIVGEFGEDRVYEDGLNIYTTLDLDQERHMQSVLKSGLMEIDKRQGYSGPIFRPNNNEEKLRARRIVEKSQKQNLFSLGDNYRLAMVERINASRNEVDISFGNKDIFVIPLEGMKWARPRDPTVDFSSFNRQSVLGVFDVGDVILVKEMSTANKDEPRQFSLESEPSVEGAMFALEPESGYVTAMHGGYSFDRSEFNRVFQACRQPGSLFKPVVYSAAIALKNYTPATMIMDAPLTFYDGANETTWRPKNFGNSYKGEVTMREAIMRSMNIPTLNIMADVGVDQVISWAKKLGIETKLKPELGTGIGSSCVTPFEMGKVFSSIANRGILTEPILVKEIKDRDHVRLKFDGKGNDAWIKRNDRINVYVQEFCSEKNVVMDEEVAFTMHYLLTEVAQHGTAAKTNLLKRHIAGKTGTTNDSFDVWFAGYSKNLMALTWIGNDMMDIPLGVYEQGAKTALPLFTQFMEGALHNLPDAEFKMPTSMCVAKIDAKTGLRITNEQPMSFKAPFRCGNEPALMDAYPNQTLEQAMETVGM